MSDTSAPIDYTESSGNVFADMGLPDAEELLLKSDLSIRLQTILEERGLTDAQAATALGLTPAQLSVLRRGRASDFSVGQLVKFLNCLGSDVEVRIAARRERPEDATLTVIAA